MRHDAGFSLIELLTALAVMSLAAGLVVMNAPGSARHLADETDGLIRSLTAARDLALVENRTVAMEITESGYAVRVTRRLGPPDIQATTPWRDGTSVAIGDGRLPALILFDPVGLADAAELTLFNKGASDGVLIETSGRIRRRDNGRQT